MNIVGKLNLMIPWSIFLVHSLLFSLQGKNLCSILTLYLSEKHNHFSNLLVLTFTVKQIWFYHMTLKKIVTD